MPPQRNSRQPMLALVPRRPAQNPTPSEPEGPPGQLPSKNQCRALNAKELSQSGMDVWSQFNCPGRFPWPEIPDPLVRLERYDGMPSGGALAALPALVESGMTAVHE
jgi:hypothetical protein